MGLGHSFQIRYFKGQNYVQFFPAFPSHRRQSLGLGSTPGHDQAMFRFTSNARGGWLRAFRRERSVGRGAGVRERSVGNFRREFPSGALRRAGVWRRVDLLVVAQKQEILVLVQDPTGARQGSFFRV